MKKSTLFLFGLIFTGVYLCYIPQAKYFNSQFRTHFSTFEYMMNEDTIKDMTYGKKLNLNVNEVKK